MENSGNKLMKSKADHFEELIGVHYEEMTIRRVGHLANIKPSLYTDANQVDRAALLWYFISETGEWFKALYPYEPYFYLKVEAKDAKDIIVFLNNTFDKLVSSIDYVDKVDLDLANHLSGKTQKYLKLSFRTVENLLEVRKALKSIITKNNEILARTNVSENIFMKDVELQEEESFLKKIIELREYDVPYYT